MLKSDLKKYYGSFVKAARALGVSPSAISQWGDVIPEKQAYRLEILTRGKLSVDLSLYRKDDGVFPPATDTVE